MISSSTLRPSKTDGKHDRRFRPSRHYLQTEPKANPSQLFRDAPLDRMKDVDRIIELVTSTLPAVQWQQLQVKFPADDDGLWFFDLRGAQNSVQIESSSGMCPFVVEHNLSDERYHGVTVEEVAAKVVEWLRL